MSNNQSNINQTAPVAAGSTPPPVVATPGLGGADGLAPSSTVSVPNSTTLIYLMLMRKMMMTVMHLRER